MHSVITDDPSVHDLLTQLDKDPTHRWSDDQTSDLGCDTSTIRRVFKRTFGTTFLDLARAHNLLAGFTTLAGGRQGIVAQLEAGFESAAALPFAYAKIFGIKPSASSKGEWGKGLACVKKIPAGQIQTYASLPNQMNRPTETRALARANGANQIAIMIPCHHIIGANRNLTGDGGSLW